MVKLRQGLSRSQLLISVWPMHAHRAATACQQSAATGLDTQLLTAPFEVTGLFMWQGLEQYACVTRSAQDVK
jgi:hypothetical protein